MTITDHQFDDYWYRFSDDVSGGPLPQGIPVLEQGRDGKWSRITIAEGLASEGWCPLTGSWLQFCSAPIVCAIRPQRCRNC